MRDSRLLGRRALLQGMVSSCMGCGSLRHFSFDAGVSSTVPQGLGDIEVTFIGVGCFLIRVGDRAILTDPFWSHMPLGRVALGHIAPDPAQITPHLPDLSDVRGVVVGHDHYDHVLDLPYVAPMPHPSAQVVASESVAHQYAPEPVGRPFVSAEAHLATADVPGAWIQLDGIRVLPVLSGHPPQWLFFHLYRKSLDKPSKHAPRRAGDFQEGTTLAFIIDWLDDQGKPTHRVFVQTSSTGLPAGRPPPQVLTERSVDVALLSMDNANFLADGKHNLIDVLDPPAVVFCHWENFFRDKTRPPREIVKVNLPKIRATLPDDRQYLIPEWDAVYRFKVP
ncbi:MAG: hypothetical protein GWP91_02210 [Rhodobacterales bacterium]|nr:hypothetical protein [Rhodobacterales bacterium]